MAESKPSDNKSNYFMIMGLVLIILICIGVILYLVFKVAKCPEIKCANPYIPNCPNCKCRGTDLTHYTIIGEELKEGQLLYPCHAIQNKESNAIFLLQDDGSLIFSDLSQESDSLPKHIEINIGRVVSMIFNSKDSLVLTFADGEPKDIFKDPIGANLKTRLQETKIIK